MSRKAKFECLKCGATHVFRPNGDGFDVELEDAEKKTERKPRAKKEPNLFEFLCGQSEEETEDDEEQD